jgi:phosphoglycerol transferase MdoB-like AlkP superfamily enzyme
MQAEVNLILRVGYPGLYIKLGGIILELSKSPVKLGLKTFKPYSKAFFWAFIICSMVIKCLYFQFITHINTRPVSASVNIYMGMSTLAVLIAIFSLLFIVSGKKTSWVLLIFDVILSVLVLSDTLYARYYTTAISIPVLGQMKLLGSVGDSVSSLFSFKDLILFFDIPVFLVWLIFFERRFPINLKLTKRLITSAVLIVISFVIFILPFSKANAFDKVYDNNQVIKKLGVVYFHFYDALKYTQENLFKDKNLTPDEKKDMDNYFALNKSTGNRFKGIASNKNLLIVQVESLQEFVINRQINGKEITPNLNKLAKDNLYFNNFYYQVEGGNTSDAEFMVNTSLYPLNEGAAYFRNSANTYYSLPKQLKEMGYNTSVFHAYNPSFWNRSVMYKNLGIDKFYSYGDFKIDEFVGWGGYALSDASFFRQSLEKLDKSKPFYSMLITLSSHHPYDYFDKNSSFDVGEYTGTSLGNYMKAINYVDSAIGQLITMLKEQGLYDNTLLVIFGDHYGLPRSQGNELFTFMGVDNNEFEWLKLQKVPLIIRVPGLDKGETISKTCGQIDLLPTIANLMGFDFPYAMGRDVLNSDRSFAIIRNYSVVTDKYLFDSTGNKVYGINDGSVLNYEDYKAEIKSLQGIRNLSQVILEKDAFKK